MSQDMVRQSQRGPSSVEDVWTGGGQMNALAYPPMPGGPGGGALGYPGGGGNDAKPLQVVHRSLRGRYKAAILLAAVFAVAGAAVGWKLNEKVYRASGLIRIYSVTFNPRGSEVTTEYGRYMKSEANSIRSQDIADRAMANEAWQKVAGTRPSNDSTRAAFLQNVKAVYDGISNDIVVTYDDKNPQVAVAAVESIIEAYSHNRDLEKNKRDGGSVEFYIEQRDAIRKDIASIKDDQNRLQRSSQGNIEDRAKMLGESENTLTRQLEQEKMTLVRMENWKQRVLANGGVIDNNTLAAREPFFARLIQARDDLAQQLVQTETLQGPQSPLVQKLRSQIASTNQRIQAIAEQLSKDYYGVLPPLGGVGPAIEVSEPAISGKREDIALLENQLKSLREDLTSVVDKRVTLSELQFKEKQFQDRLNEVEQRLADAQARSTSISAPYRAYSDPAASVASDKRTTMAMLGFLAGGGLPLLGFALWGLLDRKYRYSDETNASSITRGIPLLGILPNLPDRLSDPSQASVAAHCVHQIRTMLQLNAVNAEGPTILSVTSATSGDGKTSLSLALGLSFAASGSRTLLIDSDLIGGGLSNRLGIREPHGISEAIVARNPMEFVRDTDVADLSILPVGVSGPQNASAFSPNAVRRLLGEMRKHFDLILIDTGPVLGSIEATPVVASSDAVILTASRGQNRDLVEKAIMQLRNAGARIAGFVFNRANAKDFERSISGISLRSVSRAQATPGASGQSVNGQYQDSRLGPLVHSVRGTRDDAEN